jgi:hypothetical protein
VIRGSKPSILKLPTAQVPEPFISTFHSDNICQRSILLINSLVAESEGSTPPIMKPVTQHDYKPISFSSHPHLVNTEVHSHTSPESNTATFADDTAVVAMDSDPAIYSHKLQINLLAIQNWFKNGE